MVPFVKLKEKQAKSCFSKMQYSRLRNNFWRINVRAISAIDILSVTGVDFLGGGEGWGGRFLPHRDLTPCRPKGSPFGTF